MRLRLASLLLLAPALHSAALPYFSVLSDDAGSWPAILSSIGLQQQPASKAHIFVARAGAPASAEWTARVEQGAILILEGESSLADMFGFKRGKDSVRVSSLADVHNPKLPIVWEKSVELPVFSLPANAEVFARERWNNVPLSAGVRRGAGAVLWIAVPPGERGYERFPYLLEALSDLGMETPFRSSRLWAFFDSAYRSRVDVDYFATRWRRAGISTLQVAAWHFYDSDPEGDAYLKKLIESCHREGIQVYAWLEMPHVSEKFWADHPEWREKTALLQDAQLDWRKLMNLTNRDCSRAVAAGTRQLLTRFDWDGVNLAELYFESLEGMDNASRFTPMNDDVRAQFRQQAGFDPIELFGARKDAASRTAFLDFRAELARKMQEEWLGELENIRRTKPQLDLVLTHVDDRFDTGMRDAIGADAARVLPLLSSHNFTFLIEDPATVWNLGPQRYQAIADRYRPLTPHAEKLAIDLNIVDRYQNVYPTKQQTGTELFQLVHQAATKLLPGGAVLREFAAAARFEPAAVGGGEGHAHRAGRRKDGHRVGEWSRTAVEGAGDGRRSTLAGGGQRHVVAAAGRAFHGSGEGRARAADGAAQCGAAGRPAFERKCHRVLVRIGGTRDRGVRPAAVETRQSMGPTAAGIRRADYDSATARSTRRDNHERVS